MTLRFIKMTGAGNDFIMIDNRDLSLSAVLEKEAIASLCDRRFGIGGDGLIAVEPPRQGGKYRMRYFNSDGGEAEMCGNGARCFAAFASVLEDDEQTSFDFETMAGMIHAEIHEDLSVTINLTKPHSLEMGVIQAGGEIPYDVHSINTGVPHAVVMVDDINAVNVRRMGSELRYHNTFLPAGTNVNFVQVIEPGYITIRTYERGVENETLACGTGVTASALIHALLDSSVVSPVQVRVAGGATLTIGFVRDGEDFSDVTLTGPVALIYEGKIGLG